MKAVTITTKALDHPAVSTTVAPGLPRLATTVPHEHTDTNMETSFLHLIEEETGDLPQHLMAMMAAGKNHTDQVSVRLI